MNKESQKEEIKFINYKKYIIIISSLAVFLIIFNLMYRCNIIFATNFSDNIYKKISTLFGAIFSIFPFSIFEILLIAAILLGLFSIGRLIYYGIKYHEKGKIFRFKYRLKKTLLNLVCIILACLNVYSLNCGVNCFRLSFAACNNIITKPHSTDDLKELAIILIDKANDLSSEIATDSFGNFTMNNNAAEKHSVKAMKALSKKYPCLKDIYFEPKPIIFSEFMSMTLTMGYFAPYTVEATYNKNMPDIEIPFTLCHELAHTSGFMLEDEANFIGFLACINYDNPNFQYSGILGVMSYVLNDLYDAVSAEEYKEIVSNFNTQVRTDINRQNSYWSKYQDNKIGKVANTVYEGYLATTGQPNGLSTYGKVTDLLLAYYID